MWSFCFTMLSLAAVRAYPVDLYARDAAELGAIEVTLNHAAQITGRAPCPIGTAA